MASSNRGKQLVREIINAIEKDKELRYMLFGALGFQELLDRFTRLEEQQQKLEERLARLEEKFLQLEERLARLEERQQKLEERFLQLEERFARLEERQQKLEERFAELEERVARLEERFARLEERFAELEERQQKLEERFAELEERFARLEERQQKLEERFLQLEERVARLEERVTRLEEEAKETRRLLMVIAHRFGVLSEGAFREGMKYVVEEVLGVATVERWVYNDREGLVYGHQAIVEVDVAIRDSEHILLEVKSRVSKADVAEIHKIGILYEKVEHIKPRLVILGGLIDEDAKTLAHKLEVKIIPIVPP